MDHELAMFGLFASDAGLAIREIHEAPCIWPGGLVHPAYVRVSFDSHMRIAFYDACDSERFDPLLALTQAFRNARRK